MSNQFFSAFFSALIVLVVQTLFANDINFFGLFNPKIFPIFLLLLPRTIPSVYLMFIGFAMGFLVDELSMTLGINMFSSVLVCFLKPYVLRLMYNKDAEEEPNLNIGIQGNNFMFRYLFLMLLIYHVSYFLIEIGQFYNLFYVALKSLCSTALTVLLYFLYIYLFTREKKN